MAGERGLHFTFVAQALPEVELAVVSFDWQEALSEPFSLQLELASTYDQLLRHPLLNSRGQLAVNDQYQTEVENIYAAGDVIGWPSLASAAYDQGRCAGANMSGEQDVAPVTDIPTGIYTIPEISSIGKTEQQLTEEKIPYEVGQASFRHLARAQITGDTVGELKILFHRDTLEILGVHCFGNNAAEIIHIGQAVMNSPKNTIKYFVETTFNYPTMAEAYRVATLNGMNRLF